jgi:hypothetical protein
MPEHLAEAWGQFFVTAAGASASLVGLVIVAVSVNIRLILQQPHLPSRAGATIGALVLVLISSLAATIPQPLSALAGEVLGFSLLAWLHHLATARRGVMAGRSAQRPFYETAVAIALGQIQVIPYLIGTVMILSGAAGGAYWIAAGILATLAFAVFNAWILLVEILR